MTPGSWPNVSLQNASGTGWWISGVNEVYRLLDKEVGSKSEKNRFNGEESGFENRASPVDDSTSLAIKLRSTTAVASFGIALYRSLLCRYAHLSAENDESMTSILVVKYWRNGCGSGRHSKLSRVRRPPVIRTTIATTRCTETGINLRSRRESLTMVLMKIKHALVHESLVRSFFPISTRGRIVHRNITTLATPNKPWQN